MGGELAVLREWRLQVDKTLALTPKVTAVQEDGVVMGTVLRTP